MPHSYGGKTLPVNGLADPHLQAGGDFHVIDFGNGNVMALCPECYAAARASILNDSAGAMGGEGNVNWNSVNWNSMALQNVNWNSVNWNSIAWNPVNWNS